MTSIPPSNYANEQGREAPVSNYDKLAAHVHIMQDMVRRYLEPIDYVDRGNIVRSNGSDAEQAAFIDDIIYMLDGPEQRAVLPND